MTIQFISEFPHSECPSQYIILFSNISTFARIPTNSVMAPHKWLLGRHLGSAQLMSIYPAALPRSCGGGRIGPNRSVKLKIRGRQGHDVAVSSCSINLTNTIPLKSAIKFQLHYYYKWPSRSISLARTSICTQSPPLLPSNAIPHHHLLALTCQHPRPHLCFPDDTVRNWINHKNTVRGVH